MFKQFLFLAATLMFFFASGTVSFSSSIGQSALSMRIVPDKQVVPAGEPLVFKVVFINSGANHVSLFTGAFGTQAFSVTLLDSRLRIVCRHQEEPPGGLSIAGRYEVEPGATAEGKYVLNRWCSTLQKPGQYTLVVKYQDVARPSIALTAECQFEVVRPNREELRRVFTQAAAAILNNQSSGEETRIATDVLRFSRDPECIEFIRTSLTHNQIGDHIKEDLVKGLALVDSVDSARLLMEVSAGPAFSTTLQKTALHALHDLYEGTKSPDVRALLEKFAQSHPRPRGKIID